MNARYRRSGSITTSGVHCVYGLIGGPPGRSLKSGYFFPKRFPTSIARNKKGKKKRNLKNGEKNAVVTGARGRQSLTAGRAICRTGGAPATIPLGPRAAVSPGWFIRCSPPPNPIRHDSIIQHRYPSPPDARTPPPRRATRTPDDTGTPQPRDYCRVIV